MKSYAILSQLQPETYLCSGDFDTMFDGPKNAEYRDKQYKQGLAIGDKSDYVTISCKGTWGATGKDGSSTCAYEGIGYHAGTAALLQGFLDSGVPVVVYRYPETGHAYETWIKGENPRPSNSE